MQKQSVYPIGDNQSLKIQDALLRYDQALELHICYKNGVKVYIRHKGWMPLCILFLQPSYKESLQE